MNKIKLRPCPFCGGIAKVYGKFAYRYEGIENKPLNSDNNYKDIIKHIAKDRFSDFQNFSVVCTECGCTVYGYAVPHARLIVSCNNRGKGIVHDILRIQEIEQMKIDRLEYCFKSAVGKWNNRIDDITKQVIGK